MGGYSENTEANISDGLAYANDMGGVSGTSSPVEGSDEWWTAQINGRAVAAAENTETNPQTSALTDTGSGFFQDPRTGNMYASYEQFVRATAPGGSAYVPPSQTIAVVTPDGKVFNTTYSQYWMDPNYTGPEPSYEVKAAYSSADYAAGFAGSITNLIVGTTSNVSAAIKAIAKMYPTLSAVPKETEDLLGKGVGWLTDNLLIVVIVIAGVIILPRILPAPSRRRG